jgi:hypothetical protein
VGPEASCARGAPRARAAWAGTAWPSSESSGTSRW